MKSRPRGSYTGRWLAGSLAIGVLASGAGGLLFLHPILPASARAWEKHDFELSRPAEAMLGYRIELTILIAALMAMGVGSGLLVRKTSLRAGVLLVCLLVLMAIAVAGILGWWMMYVDLYRQASEM